MKRLLGIDAGRVRVGVALSDPLGMIAQPLEVILRKRDDPFKRIAALVIEYEVEGIVVGLPSQLDGSAGEAVHAIMHFVDKLRQKVSVPIETWDERMTTALAERTMIDAGVRREARRERIDKVAAALILQSYLDARSV
ncbi:MAG: Holliday junction resolvase RuvX [Myxococcota bacterium]